MPSSIAVSLARIAHALALCLVFALPGVGAVPAHEGHDHGAPEPASQALVSPRIAAVSERYELVGIARNHELTIYIDRFDTNAPVTDVDVAVTIGDRAEPFKAKRRDDGVYVIDTAALDGHGPLDMVFSITGGEGDDLLVGALGRPEAAATVAQEPGVVARLRQNFAGIVPERAVLPVALGLAFAGLLAAFALRRRPGLAVLFVLLTLGGAGGLIASAYAHEEHGIPHDPAGDPAARGPDEPAAHDHPPGEAHDHHDHHDHPVVPVYDPPGRNPDGSAFVPKPTQRLLEVRTQIMQEQEARAAVGLIGRVIADPNGTGLVQSMSGGRIIAPEGGLPRIGEKVKKGEILATVERPIPPEERVILSEKVGEIDQLIAVAERKLQRTRQLLERNVAPEAQVRDAETELIGLRERRRIVQETRAEAEILSAPVDGVVSAAKVVPGQVVASQDVLFELVDPSRLWVEALVYGETDPAALAEASATTVDGTHLKLVHKGFSRALREQAAVVHFAIDNPPATLSVGQPLRVLAEAGEAQAAMVLPRAAVVRSANGQQIVWRHDAPERFVAVPIRAESLDSARVTIAAGIEPGARIVTQGASLVNQIR